MHLHSNLHVPEPSRQDRFHRAVHEAMDQETRKIVDEEAKAAAARVEERVRGLAGQIATKLARCVHMDRSMDEIRITVKLPSEFN